jgi:glycosyltransferase involved in cell wall biosynthesis
LIHVIPAGDAEALRRALAQALDDSTGNTGIARITGAEREALSWRAYAMRHLEVMLEMQRPQANDQVQEVTNDARLMSPKWPV